MREHTPKDFAGSWLFASNTYALITKDTRGLVQQLFFRFQKGQTICPEAKSLVESYMMDA
jgi:hypothetical protein